MPLRTTPTGRRGCLSSCEGDFSFAVCFFARFNVVRRHDTPPCGTLPVESTRPHTSIKYIRSHIRVLHLALHRCHCTLRAHQSQSTGTRLVNERIEINRRNWNERTPIHAASEMYDIEGFKAGRMTLTDIEIDEIGPIKGKSLLHLQCHFGLDTMSWARLGATVTGVDLSDASIVLARELNEELGLDARFIRSNVYDLPKVLDEHFDIVYTALGALCWLPDLTRWGQIIARYLKPGGTFYMLDEHPTGRIFDAVQGPDGNHELKPTWSYFPDPEGILEEGERPTYTGSGTIDSPVYEWQHSLSEIVNSLIKVGLKLEFMHEFPFLFFQSSPLMRRDDGGWWRLDEYDGNIPFILSIKANR